MKLVTFGCSKEELSHMSGDLEPSGADSPLSKALTAAVLVGSAVIMARNTSPPRGGIELTNIRR